MTKITTNEKVVLAAILGGSNLGQPKPSRETVQRELTALGNAVYKHTPVEKVTAAACNFWGRYMDDDGAEKVFVGECKWWLRDKTNWASREYVARIWPDVAALVW